MPTTTKRIGRPRKDPELAVCHGVMVQPKFPRAKYREVQAAAAAAGMPITTWIRSLVYLALDEKQRRDQK